MMCVNDTSCDGKYSAARTDKKLYSRRIRQDEFLPPAKAMDGKQRKVVSRCYWLRQVAPNLLTTRLDLQRSASQDSLPRCTKWTIVSHAIPMTLYRKAEYTRMGFRTERNTKDTQCTGEKRNEDLYRMNSNMLLEPVPHVSFSGRDVSL